MKKSLLTLASLAILMGTGTSIASASTKHVYGLPLGGTLKIKGATWTQAQEYQWIGKEGKSFHDADYFSSSASFYGRNGAQYYFCRILGLDANDDVKQVVFSINHHILYSMDSLKAYFLKYGGTVGEWNKVSENLY